MTSSSDRYLYGMLLMFISAILFSSMTILVKYSQGVNTFLITFVRFFLGLLFLITGALGGKIKLHPHAYGWLAVRGICGGIAVALLYLGIAKIGLGKGTMLNYTYPIFASMLAPLILREKLRKDIWIAQAVALVGCYFLLNPKNLFSFNPIDLLVLAGGFSAGIAVNAIRKLTHTENTYTIFLSFCLCSCLMFAYPAFSNPLPHTTLPWIILLGIGLLGTVGQLAMTAGYKYVPVTEGSLMAFLVPVLNLLVSAFFFQEQITSSVILGSILVIVSCIYTTMKRP